MILKKKPQHQYQDNPVMIVLTVTIKEKITILLTKKILSQKANPNKYAKLIQLMGLKNKVNYRKLLKV